MNARAYLFVALGGMIGALARYGVSAGSDAAFDQAAIGTFIANISGAFMLGYFSTVTAAKISLSLDLRRFVAVGMLGSYTTFSALSYQTLQLMEAGNLAGAFLNAAGSMAAGLLAVFLGVRLART